MSKKYHKVNVKTIQERQKKYYYEHKEERKEYVKEYQKEYRKKNKSLISKKRKKYRKENMDILMSNNRKRRARKRNVKENYTIYDEQYTRELFDHKCANCGATDDLCIDHHKPLSKGNPLTRKNAVLLCNKCNTEKWAFLPEEFYEPVKLLWIESKLQSIKE